MTTAQKFVGGLVAAMVLTAVLLPGRQTVPALNAVTNLVTSSEHTAITGAA
jgi:hypothetical protein